MKMSFKKFIAGSLCVGMFFAIMSCSSQNELLATDTEETSEVTTTTEEILDDLEFGINPTPFYRIDESQEYVKEIDGVTMKLIDACGCVIIEVTNDSAEPFVVDMDCKIYQQVGDSYIEVYDGADDDSPFYTREIIDEVGSEDVIIDDTNTFTIYSGEVFMLLRYVNIHALNVGHYKIDISGFEIEYDVYEDVAW